MWHFPNASIWVGNTVARQVENGLCCCIASLTPPSLFLSVFSTYRGVFVWSWFSVNGMECSSILTVSLVNEAYSFLKKGTFLRKWSLPHLTMNSSTSYGTGSPNPPTLMHVYSG